MIIAAWPAPATIKAYTTTREGGVSQPPFASFNLGEHVGDDPMAVQRNRGLLRQQLQLPGEPLWLEQVHGTRVVCADHANYADHVDHVDHVDRLRHANDNSRSSDNAEKALTKDPQRISNPLDLVVADAAYTHQPNVVCAVLTADCLPVLLCARRGNSVAAVHAGWRGLVAGVIEHTVQALQIPGSELLAWLGPAIGPTMFEVGEEVQAQFVAVDDQAQAAFTATTNNRWLADIYLLARQRLQRCGVTAIYGGDYCTYSQQQTFFSYRRDRQTGRMASVIWFTEP